MVDLPDEGFPTKPISGSRGIMIFYRVLAIMNVSQKSLDVSILLPYKKLVPPTLVDALLEWSLKPAPKPDAKGRALRGEAGIGVSLQHHRQILRRQIRISFRHSIRYMRKGQSVSVNA